MELEFDRDVIQGCEVLADGTVCQEETLESIVPDACPDMGRRRRYGKSRRSWNVRTGLLRQSLWKRPLPEGCASHRNRCWR